MMPPITIAIPTYNGEKYIAECIESALNQNYPYYEIVVVDDHSSDKTVEIIKRFQEKSNKIFLYRNKKNLGLTGNWNKCIELAKTEWIKFIFQDDVLSPNCLQIMQDQMEKDATEFGICGRDFIIENDTSEFQRFFFTYKVIKPDKIFVKGKISREYFNNAIKDYLFTNVLGEPITFLFKKSLVSKFSGFSEYIPQLCDFEFALRIISNIGFSFVPETLVHFRVHGNSASQENHTSKSHIISDIEPLLLLHNFLFCKYYRTIKTLVGKKYLFADFKQKLNLVNNKYGIIGANKIFRKYIFAYPFLQMHKLFYFREMLISLNERFLKD